MRTGLISAIARTAAHGLRAELPLAGRTVLAWQVAVMRDLGAERIVCLCESVSGEVLRLQHQVEASGAAFHSLKGFVAIPALVRGDDELIILRDGLVPDPALVRALLEADPVLHKQIICLSADHPLAAAYPEDFERIDAARHWAGVLVMRGAPAQQLDDFSADADAVSVLLRLALQSGTPCRMAGPGVLEPGTWLLASSARAVTLHEQALIAQAAPEADWRAPAQTLAAVVVRRLAPRGLEQGPLIGAAAALVLLFAGLVTAANGAAAVGLAIAAIGAFAAQISIYYAALRGKIFRRKALGPGYAMLDKLVDGTAALTAWFALAPWPDWQPLAVCGPLAIGLARLAARERRTGLTKIAADRGSHLLVLALAASFGVLPETVALMVLAVLAALLLRGPAD